MQRLPFKTLLIVIVCTAMLSLFTCILLMTNDPGWWSYAAPWAAAVSWVFFVLYHRQWGADPDLNSSDDRARYRISGSLSAALAGISTLLIPVNKESPVWYEPALIVAGILLIIGALLVLLVPLILKSAPGLSGRTPD